MDIKALRPICRRYRGKDYYVDPIPPTKAAGARRSLGVPSSETIVALVDFTVLGGAEDAMVITEGGLYWKNLADESPTELSWQQLRQASLSEKKTIFSKVIDFGNGVEMDMNGATQLTKADNQLVINLLTELKKALSVARPSGQAALAPEKMTVGFIECEICKGLVKPDVLYCKHCGVRLRG